MLITIRREGTTPNLFAYMEILFLTAVWLSHVTPWRSYLCTQTHQRSLLKLNSRIEEIFVRKSQIVGTRMFLVSRWVWGPVRQRFLWKPSCMPSFHSLHLVGFQGPWIQASPSLGSLWSWIPLTLSSKDACFRFNSPKALQAPHHRAGSCRSQVGVRSLGILGKGKAGTFLVNPIKPNVMISLSKPAF